MQAFVDGKLQDIDINAPLEDLLFHLAEAGITSLYQTQATGHYQGRSYPQILLTAFGGPEIRLAEKIFIKWNQTYKDTLKQEAFAYEVNGNMFVYRF